MNKTLWPSAALMKLIYSRAEVWMSLVRDYSQESTLVTFRLVQANSLSLYTRLSFSFCCRDLFLYSDSIDFIWALSFVTSSSFSLLDVLKLLKSSICFSLSEIYFESFNISLSFSIISFCNYSKDFLRDRISLSLLERIRVTS